MTSTAHLALTDSHAFRAGQQHMARHIAELLRIRRAELEALPITGPGARQTLAIRSELAIAIRAVDALAYPNPHG